MRRGVRYAAALVVLACFLITGCMSGEASLKVNKGGDGTFVAEVFPPGQTRIPLRKVQVEKLLESAFGELGGVKVDTVKEDGLTGYRVEVPFQNTDEIVSYFNKPMAVGVHQVKLFSQFSLVKEADTGGDNWRLDATVNPLNQVFSPLAGDQTFAGVVEAITDGGNATSLELRFTVALPGDIVNSNADERGGGSATWIIDDAATPTVVTALSKPKEFPTTLQKAMMGVGAAILLGLVLIGLSKSMSRSKATRRMSRKDRKAAKARRITAEGWGPKGPSALPSRPAPTTDIGRSLPGVGNQPNQEPGSYDPVRGIRVGHEPTAGLSEPSIGVQGDPGDLPSGHHLSGPHTPGHHEVKPPPSGIHASQKIGPGPGATADPGVQAAAIEAAALEDAVVAKATKSGKSVKSKKDRTKGAKKAAKGEKVAARKAEPEKSQVEKVQVDREAETGDADWFAPPEADPRVVVAQQPTAVVGPEPEPEPEVEPESEVEPAPEPEVEPAPEPEPEPEVEPESEVEPEAQLQTQMDVSTAVPSTPTRSVPRVFGAQPSEVGPVSDESVAEAVADAFSGTEGDRRWARGPLTDREVAQALLEAVSEPVEQSAAGSDTTAAASPEATLPEATSPEATSPEAARPEATLEEVADSEDFEMEPNWYPDPDDPDRFRWWDGRNWTDYVY